MNLKETNEKIDLLEEKLNKIINLLTPKEDNKANTMTYGLNTKTLTSDCNNPDDFLNLVKSKSQEFTDEHDNVYVQLPTIWLKINGKQLLFSFDEMNDWIELQPQAISKYKNSLVDGKIRSIPNHAPDFSQFSFNKATKFCHWVDGEQLNWKTVLYIQIMWAYAYQTKGNNNFLPNENWKWDETRDCGFGDTGKGIGEFLGIEQLFTSGRNFVSFDNREESSDLWNLYILWNYDSDFDADNQFGLWGDFDKNESTYSAFFSGWDNRLDTAWSGGSGGVRLCKTILKG